MNISFFSDYTLINILIYLDGTSVLRLIESCPKFYYFCTSRDFIKPYTIYNDCNFEETRQLIENYKNKNNAYVVKKNKMGNFDILLHVNYESKNLKLQTTCLKRMTLKRIEMEMRNLKKSGISCIHLGNFIFLDIVPNESKFNEELASIGLNTFELKVKIPDDYPFGPPSVKIIKPTVKPNSNTIYKNGKICLAMLNRYHDSWSPMYGLSHIVHCIQLILEKTKIDLPHNK